MPELPEVETTRRGLEPHLAGQRIAAAVVRNRALRWPVPAGLERRLAGLTIGSIARRGKYLVIDCGRGSLIVHLGMSGRMLVLAGPAPAGKHDHFELQLGNGKIARLTDPRRFGSVHWIEGDPLTHPLLAALGPEPFSDAFSAQWLHARTRGRSAAIKNTLMDSRVVAGIGNIYASEALFRAAIHPGTASGRIALPRCVRLVEEIRATLGEAIAAGGSSMRDYLGSDGQAGYFQFNWLVYGREGEACKRCAAPVRQIRQGQRSTYYCARCQK
jgi:formamidopyrimidine-DNA glycosylase